MEKKRSRKLAEQTARAILDSGRIVTDADVLLVLRKWAFRKNKSRKNVLPPGSEGSMIRKCPSTGKLTYVQPSAAPQVPADPCLRATPRIRYMLGHVRARPLSRTLQKF